METVRVLTYNVHCCIDNAGAYRLDGIAAVVRRSGADIACLQEVEFNSALRKTRKWSAVHADKQPVLLSKATGLSYWSFVGPLTAHMEEDTGQGEVLVRDPKNEAVYGNAILSRFPILDKRTLLFKAEEPPLSASTISMDSEEQPRGACAVLVDTAGARGEGKSSEPRPGGALACCMAPGQHQGPAAGKGSPSVPLWVVNTHLSHKPCSDEQRRQARQLLDWIEGICSSHAGPVRPGVLLCGDLNSSSCLPFSSYSTITSGGRWKDLWRERGTCCCQATFPSTCGTPACGLHLDHLLALQAEKAAELSCEAIRILGDPQDADASDHFGVIADIAIKG
mmetsp:Transcript_80161/g.248786  ORF Transcript_80161/g.248786 Transcript_80161/m.248786 type:complete len:337 (-) Transcript_80161:17-1027(-)